MNQGDYPMKSRQFIPLSRNLALGVLGAVMLFSLAVNARAQDASAKAYEKAYGYILEEKWQNAQESFTAFVKTYPKSKSVDAAQYWLCYTRDKKGESQEDVFECYNKFIKSYPKSKWSTTRNRTW